MFTESLMLRKVHQKTPVISVNTGIHAGKPDGRQEQAAMFQVRWIRRLRGE
jgi:hypothetical protein